MFIPDIKYHSNLGRGEPLPVYPFCMGIFQCSYLCAVTACTWPTDHAKAMSEWIKMCVQWDCSAYKARAFHVAFEKTYEGALC